ncbi:hypothetical protein Tsubulata_030143 [Turnera subulata]|uniref:F-box associated beta-propeller type 1 domain-containing protein n=1 Tax=Turnera subulata TaxID=218843 RepID=A0A9Q0FS85_9ROSI|nr:hypothetical protein Tsubulata_030143 [Turnera subulata]
MSSWGAVDKRKREECGDYNKLLVDEAKSTITEQLVISTNMAAPNRSYLPPDILEGILDLLTKKSIERFRSVSKSLFYSLAVPKLLYHPEFSPSDYGIKSLDDRRLFPAVVLSDYGSDDHACNRLVCRDVSNDHCGKWETIVWNPVTGICRKLPRRNNYGYPFGHGFGYDSATDDYKFFVVTDPDRPTGDCGVEIISMKTGSWRKVENIDSEYLQRIRWLPGMGLFLNGALHWGPQLSPWGKEGKIIAFDLGKEKFFYVPSPPDQISPSYDQDCSMGVVGEYL